MRTSGLVQTLAQRHEVHLLCQSWPGQAAEPPPEELGLTSYEAVTIGRIQLARAVVTGGVSGLVGGQPMQAQLFRHGAFEEAALRAVASIQPDVVVVVLSRLGHVHRALRRRYPRLPVVLDLIDALVANMRRRAEREKWLAPLWLREARRLDAWDAGLAQDSAAATVVAERDREALLEAVDARDQLDERLHVIPFGLDVPSGPHVQNRPASASGEKPELTIVLTGNLGYFPTVEGARFFAQEVWPRVRQRHKGARWLLAGARPAKSIRDLATLDGVEVQANPPDLAAVLKDATVSIAPLRAGSGTPIKILEAMVAGVPVVTTPAGRDGLDELPEGAVTVADGAEAFADQVGDLLSDPERRHRQAETAWRWERDRHHLPRVGERFEALLERIAGGSAP